MIRISLFESPKEFYDKLDKLDYETSYSVIHNEIQGRLLPETHRFL